MNKKDNLQDINTNDFQSLAIRKDGKIVEMVNIYTGEHRVLTFIRIVKLLFQSII